MRGGCYDQRNGVATSNELVWGDYFLLEALLGLDGTINPSLLYRARPLPAIASCLAGIDPEVLAKLRRQHTKQAERKMATGPAWRDHGLIFASGTSAGAGSETEFSQRSRWQGRLSPAIRTQEAQCA
ncbi:MAG TPA: hypothetical protein VGJ54_19015 [Streptosporangiaceae bacterium]|jgi:hypothetical protein